MRNRDRVLFCCDEHCGVADVGLLPSRLVPDHYKCLRHWLAEVDDDGQLFLDYRPPWELPSTLRQVPGYRGRK